MNDSEYYNEIASWTEQNDYWSGYQRNQHKIIQGCHVKSTVADGKPSSLISLRSIAMISDRVQEFEVKKNNQMLP